MGRPSEKPMEQGGNKNLNPHIWHRAGMKPRAA